MPGRVRAELVRVVGTGAAGLRFGAGIPEVPSSTRVGPVSVDRVRLAVVVTDLRSSLSTTLPVALLPLPSTFSTFLGAFVTSPSADRFFGIFDLEDASLVSRVLEDALRFNIGMLDPAWTCAKADDDDTWVEVDGLEASATDWVERLLDPATGGAFSSGLRPVVRRVCA